MNEQLIQTTSTQHSFRLPNSSLSSPSSYFLHLKKQAYLLISLALQQLAAMEKPGKATENTPGW